MAQIENSVSFEMVAGVTEAIILSKIQTASREAVGTHTRPLMIVNTKSGLVYQHGSKLCRQIGSSYLPPINLIPTELTILGNVGNVVLAFMSAA